MTFGLVKKSEESADFDGANEGLLLRGRFEEITDLRDFVCVFGKSTQTDLFLLT